MPRVTNYNLRDIGLKVSQPFYNNRFMHNFFSYSIPHVWNNLPFSTKSTTTVQQFRLLIYKVTVMSELYFVALIYCKLYVLIILYIYFLYFVFFPAGFLIRSIFNWIYVADILKDFYTSFMKIILYSIAFYVFIVFFSFGRAFYTWAHGLETGRPLPTSSTIKN